MKTTLFQVLGLWVYPNLKYSSKCFVQIHRGSMKLPCWLTSVVHGRFKMWTPQSELHTGPPFKHHLDPIWTPYRSHLNPLCGPHLNSSWDPSEPHLDPIWVPFGPLLDSFRTPSGHPSGTPIFSSIKSTIEHNTMIKYMYIKSGSKI